MSGPRLLIVGCGMFGAAVARYAAPRAETIVVGPAESTANAFGAHYDEGRIVAQLGVDPVWIELVRSSVAGMHELDPGLLCTCGTAFAAPQADARPIVEAAAALREWLGLDVRTIDEAERAAAFPLLSFTESETVLYERGGGYFSPRRYVALATAAAAASGARIVRNVVRRVHVERDGVRVECEDRTHFDGDAAVVSAGAFTIDTSLLPVASALRAKSETYLLAEVDERAAASTPCVVRVVDDPEIGEVYALPPIRYPDGRSYIKIGANTLADRWLESADELASWYARGDTTVQEQVLRRAFRELLPDVRVHEWHVRRCADAYTAHDFPYVDAVEPGRLFVVTGGNGRGAQVADALGALASALAIDGAWPSELPDERFAFVAADGTWAGAELLADRRRVASIPASLEPCARTLDNGPARMEKSGTQ